MKFEVKDEKNCRKVISVEVSKEKMAPVEKKIFESFRDSARLDGYRKGKAPDHIVRAKFKKEIDEETVKEVVQETYGEVMKQAGLKVVTYPMLKDVKNTDDGLKYQIVVEVDPVFELKDYKNIKVDKKELKEVKDADVRTEIDKIRQYRGKMVDSLSDTAKEGDYVTISFAGFVDGKAGEGMASDNQILRIGEGQFIKDLEEGMVGMKLGEEKDINVKFPADYQKKELAGKPAVFKVKMKEIKTLEMPEMNDAFAREISGKETVAELEALIKDELQKQAQEDIKNASVNQVITELLKMHEFELPQGLVEEEINNIVSRYQNNLSQQGLTLKALNMTIEDLRERSRKQAYDNIRVIYILKKIAEKEGIEATDADVEAEIRKIALSSKGNPDDMVKQARARGSWHALKARLTEDRVIDSLIQA
ncbi:MAG: trigger factor [Spirochaetia bacterium]|nr:trigger factor [Spirochaetia bacterium]